MLFRVDLLSIIVKISSVLKNLFISLAQYCINSLGTSISVASDLI